MISQTAELLYRHNLELALVGLLDFAEGYPDKVEWDEIDKIYSDAWISLAMDKVDNFISETSGRLLVDLLRKVIIMLLHTLN